MSERIEHSPTDMTVRVDANITLAELQEHLRSGGQWLPLDPPASETTTIETLLSENLSGPRRYGYGTARDFVIGIKCRLADGRVIKSGGNVVKNVAGYDMQKLFIGAQGTLGPVIEAIFKLRPLPESEKWVQRTCTSLEEAGQLIERVFDSPITPTVFDLHGTTVVLGFDGTREEVEWQLSEAQKLGIADPGSPEYEKELWMSPASPIQKISVLPSKLIEQLQQMPAMPYVARAGNGIIYYQGPAPAIDATLPSHLWKRTKTAFDPQSLFPSLST